MPDRAIRPEIEQSLGVLPLVVSITERLRSSGGSDGTRTRAVLSDKQVF
jgi:hypothetical protein